MPVAGKRAGGAAKPQAAQPVAEPRPIGRPSEYTAEIAERICALIVESDYGLEQICDAHDDLPSARTVFRWLRAHEDFRQQYARTKVDQSHVQAGRAVKDAIEAKDAQLGRLAYDARRWHAGKLNAKEYGDKVALTGGSEDDAPIKTVQRIERVIVRPPDRNA